MWICAPNIRDNSILRSNITFRIQKSILDDFKSICKKEAVTANLVITELIIREQFYNIVNLSWAGTEEGKSVFRDFFHLGFAHKIIIISCRPCENQSKNKKTQVYSLMAIMKEFKNNNKLISRINYQR